jgi:hypothetical protein
MAFDNIRIDHKKLVSRFYLDDEEKLLKCCHFTNLKPLLCKDNLGLYSIWSDKYDLFWNESIIYKPEYNSLYKL